MQNLTRTWDHLQFFTWVWRIHRFVGMDRSFNATISWTWSSCFLVTGIYSWVEVLWWSRMPFRFLKYNLFSNDRFQSMQILVFYFPWTPLCRNLSYLIYGFPAKLNLNHCISCLLTFSIWFSSTSNSLMTMLDIGSSSVGYNIFQGWLHFATSERLGRHFI